MQRIYKKRYAYGYGVKTYYVTENIIQQETSISRQRNLVFKRLYTMPASVDRSSRPRFFFPLTSNFGRHIWISGRARRAPSTAVRFFPILYLQMALIICLPRTVYSLHLNYMTFGGSFMSLQSIICQFLYWVTCFRISQSFDFDH